MHKRDKYINESTYMEYLYMRSLDLMFMDFVREKNQIRASTNFKTEISLKSVIWKECIKTNSSSRRINHSF